MQPKLSDCWFGVCFILRNMRTSRGSITIICPIFFIQFAEAIVNQNNVVWSFARLIQVLSFYFVPPFTPPPLNYLETWHGSCSHRQSAVPDVWRFWLCVVCIAHAIFKYTRTEASAKVPAAKKTYSNHMYTWLWVSLSWTRFGENLNASQEKRSCFLGDTIQLCGQFAIQCNLHVWKNSAISVTNCICVIYWDISWHGWNWIKFFIIWNCSLFVSWRENGLHPPGTRSKPPPFIMIHTQLNKRARDGKRANAHFVGKVYLFFEWIWLLDKVQRNTSIRCQRKSRAPLPSAVTWSPSHDRGEGSCTPTTTTQTWLHEAVLTSSRSA